MFVVDRLQFKGVPPPACPARPPATAEVSSVGDMSGDTPPATDPVRALAGAWSIERVVRDLAHGHDAAFTGLAHIAPDGHGLTWAEEGCLVTEGHAGPARRSLRIAPAGGGWEVLFEDGRPFHPLDLAGGACTVVHLCGRDRYDGTYRLAGADTLFVRWRVTGPAKDLDIRSEYRRRDETDAGGAGSVAADAR